VGGGLPPRDDVRPNLSNSAVTRSGAVAEERGAPTGNCVVLGPTLTAPHRLRTRACTSTSPRESTSGRSFCPSLLVLQRALSTANDLIRGAPPPLLVVTSINERPPPGAHTGTAPLAELIPGLAWEKVKP
jgi:hypothetical protein